MKISWNKNTINRSEINKTIELLKEFKVDYKLKILGKVRGDGLNDDINGTPEHEIRRLEYNDFVILEQMIRSQDCDIDDVILSFKFEKSKAPKKWDLEK